VKIIPDWLWRKTLFRNDEEWRFFGVVDAAESRTDPQRDREEAERLLRPHGGEAKS
jgi:hypothetical protein